MPYALPEVKQVPLKAQVIWVENRNAIIPLFPLEAVLFPHSAIPLHVFEPRYRELVIHCLEQDSPFGIVLIREGREVGGGEVKLYEIGTLARIGRLRRLEDGRFHLIALGEERFRIRHLIQGERPYLQAEIVPWRDAPPHDEQELAQLAQAVKELFEGFLQIALDSVGLRLSDLELPDDPVVLSFTVASTLQGSLPFRQYLLELQDTAERLRLLYAVLEQLAQGGEIRAFNPDNWKEYICQN